MTSNRFIKLNVFHWQKAVETEDSQLNLAEAPLPVSAFPASPIPSSLSVSMHMMPSQIYGPEHFLRLFGKKSYLGFLWLRSPYS